MSSLSYLTDLPKLVTSKQELTPKGLFTLEEIEKMKKLKISNEQEIPQVNQANIYLQVTIEQLRQRVQTLEAGTIEGKIKNGKEKAAAAIDYLKGQGSKVKDFFGQLKDNAKNGLNSLTEKAKSKAADFVASRAEKAAENYYKLSDEHNELELSKENLESELKQSRNLELDRNKSITKILMSSIYELGSAFDIDLDKMPEFTEEQNANPELAMDAIQNFLNQDGEINNAEREFLDALQKNINNLKEVKPEGIVPDYVYNAELKRISINQSRLSTKIGKEAEKFKSRQDLASKLRGVSVAEDTQQANENEAGIENNPFKSGDLGENLLEVEEIVDNPQIPLIAPSPSNIVPSEDSNNTPLSPTEVLPPESKGEFPVFKILPPAVEASAVPEKTDLNLDSIMANLAVIQVGQDLKLCLTKTEEKVTFKKVDFDRFEMIIPNGTNVFGALEDLAKLIVKDTYRYIPMTR